MTDYTRRKITPQHLIEKTAEPIALCPKCNRPGVIRYYPRETFGMVFHTSEQEGMMNIIKDHCTITHDQARKLYTGKA